MGFFLRVSPVQTCIMRIGKEICRKLLTERGDDREAEETDSSLLVWHGGLSEKSGFSLDVIVPTLYPQVWPENC